MYDEKISKDLEKKFFEMNLHAAKNGLVESMNVVAKFYMEGVGVEKNLDEAIKWLKKVDDTGDEFASVTLGKIYSKYSESKNIDKAIFYL